MSKISIKKLKLGSGALIKTKRSYEVSESTEITLELIDGRFIFKLSGINKFIKKRLARGQDIYIQFGRYKPGKRIKKYRDQDIIGIITQPFKFPELPTRLDLTNGIKSGQLEYDITEWLWDLLHYEAYPKSSIRLPKSAIVTYLGRYASKSYFNNITGILNTNISLSLMGGYINKSTMPSKIAHVHEEEDNAIRYNIGRYYTANAIGNIQLNIEYQNKSIRELEKDDYNISIIDYDGSKFIIQVWTENAPPPIDR